MPTAPPTRQQLQIDQNLRLHQVGWRVQAGLLALLFGFVFCAVAGLFGNGIASNAEVKDTSGISISYERFARYQTAVNITVWLPAGLAEDDQTTIALPASMVAAFRPEKCTPAPSLTRYVDGLHLYTFAFKTSEAAHIMLEFQPQQLGRYTGEIGVNKAKLPISTYTYP